MILARHHQEVVWNQDRDSFQLKTPQASIWAHVNQLSIAILSYRWRIAPLTPRKISNKTQWVELGKRKKTDQVLWNICVEVIRSIFDALKHERKPWAVTTSMTYQLRFCGAQCQRAEPGELRLNQYLSFGNFRLRSKQRRRYTVSFVCTLLIKNLFSHFFFFWNLLTYSSDFLQSFAHRF